jgi:hypothetical protein
MSPVQQENAQVKTVQLGVARVIGSVLDGFRMIALQFGDLVLGKGAPIQFVVLYHSPSLPDFSDTPPNSLSGAQRPSPVALKYESGPSSPPIKV